MFKKLVISLILILAGSVSFAGPSEDVAAFFDKYVAAANSYDENIPTFYAPDAKIIRVVVKKDGTKESVVTDTGVYMKQLRMNSKLAKVRNYKNYYTDRVITQVGNDYKLTCKRQPSLSDYKLPAHFVIGKDSSGNYKIKEESMDTYQTAILVGAKRQSK
ncbi:hypothetical protein IJE86_10705 [bacterium]|nr:hypothetical protein [bacterium]